MVSSWPCYGGGWNVRWEISIRYGQQAADSDLTKIQEKAVKIVQASAQFSPALCPLQITSPSLHKMQGVAALTDLMWDLKEILLQAKTCHGSLQVERVILANHCYLLCCLSLLFNFCDFSFTTSIFFIPFPYSFISYIFYFSVSSLPILSSSLRSSSIPLSFASFYLLLVSLSF